MFKLPSLPTPKAEVHELADFAELLAQHNGYVSIREILAYLGRVSENDPNEGIDDEDDLNAALLDDVFDEISRRSSSCDTGYPFRLEMNGTVLRHNSADETVRADVYRYLLLSTRLNMTRDKFQDGLDGTCLLEELAALVIRCYLGYDRARSFVFGTAVAGGFSDKVNRLCDELGEGVRYESIDPAPTHANDDKLDAVAWIPFTDSRGDQLVVFCQCKTGSNWRDLTTQLQPSTFIQRWTSARKFLYDPLRAFCISEAPNPSRWNGLAVYAGLLFDRLRIIDFLDRTDVDLHVRIKRWNAGAIRVFEQALG
ncbi:hypothetical protein H6G65_02885 [Microcystis elabens FACHB-917]|jgi:hypothetical protein|nr:hypothetical protein [Microcystis elabens FACHB-917]